jgi:hypothetical protein
MVASKEIVEYIDLIRSLDSLNIRLGIKHLTASETAILLAIANNELTNNSHTSLADLTLSKTDIRLIPRATLFRCLRTLTEKSLIKHVGNKRSGEYCLA